MRIGAMTSLTASGVVDPRQRCPATIASDRECLCCRSYLFYATAIEFHIPRGQKWWKKSSGDSNLLAIELVGSPSAVASPGYSASSSSHYVVTGDYVHAAERVLVKRARCESN